MKLDHWFDTLNKQLTRASLRRDFLSATALPILLHLGAPDAAGKGGGKGGKQKGGGKGKKGGGGKKGHGKGHGNKKPPKPDTGGICGRTWPGEHQQADRDHCRRIFAECPPDGDREFCIVDNYPGHEGDDVADCCEEGEKCCGAQCCPADHHCCGKFCCKASQPCCGGVCGPDASESDVECCDGLLIGITSDRENCGGCGVKCGANEVCVDKQCTCAEARSTASARDAASCDDCPAGQTRCGSSCVDTKIDPTHCGLCNKTCREGQECRNGTCGCPTTCPQGKNCYEASGQTCAFTPDSDCSCRCPDGYEYCMHREGYMVCVGDCSYVQ